MEQKENDDDELKKSWIENNIWTFCSLRPVLTGEGWSQQAGPNRFLEGSNWMKMEFKNGLNRLSEPVF